MKQHLRLWLLLVGIFSVVLCATLISCDREAMEAEPVLIETKKAPSDVFPEVRCCEDESLKNTDTKSDKTEDE